ncbi:MAG: hypothetical protein NVSMB67_24540 [Flavisolibacter sp.]
MQKLTVPKKVLLRFKNCKKPQKLFKPFLILLLSVGSFTYSTNAQISVVSRWNEVFQHTDLVPAVTGLNDPWEITYGPDDSLWITEAKGYRVLHMDPNSGAFNVVLDITDGSTFLPPGYSSFNRQFTSAQNPWPQGGLMGLAIHPSFKTGKPYVYIAYVYQYNSTTPGNGGVFFTNRLVRFTDSAGILTSPISLCDTLPGSSDHNSGRIIIAPINGVNYLFYAEGDMGAGQFGNTNRTENAQMINSYEGKILRFNLEPDADPGVLDMWIPNDNPFNTGPVANPTTQSAVWVTGIRNNQGFASANIGGTDYLYGASHGPFSDDEVNIFQKSMNYGHPLVIGFNDGNYDGSSAGASPGSLPIINSEAANATAIGASYRDPIYSFYAAPKGDLTVVNSIAYIWDQFNFKGNGNNSQWPSEAPSGMDIYKNTVIPGWKNSLLLGALKGGKVMRLNLNSTGNGINTSAGFDTVNYFRSVNRFRDLAISPDGYSIFTVIDKSSTTSGPTTGNPMVSACAGCVQKYTFLGYLNDNLTNGSTIPNFIDIAGTTAPNSCNLGDSITITSINDTLWIPITGPDGNIVAEIRPGAANMDGAVFKTSYYINSGAVRQSPSYLLYADRNITIKPNVNPITPVGLRLYLTATEYNNLKAATNSKNQPSGITVPSDLRILKNADTCGIPITNTSTILIPTVNTQSTRGYVLQTSVSSFSTFYISSSSMIVLPVKLVSFKGSIKDNAGLLQWSTTNETNLAMFLIERSIDGKNFDRIATVFPQRNNGGTGDYSYLDNEAATLSSPTVFYRLEMVDYSKASTYSDLVALQFNNVYSVFVYPVPIKDELNARINLKSSDNIEIEVSDIHGRIVYEQTRYISAGITEIKINTRSWPSQSYFVKVRGSNHNSMMTKKVIKM